MYYNNIKSFTNFIKETSNYDLNNDDDDVVVKLGTVATRVSGKHLMGANFVRNVIVYYKGEKIIDDFDVNREKINFCRDGIGMGWLCYADYGKEAIVNNITLPSKYRGLGLTSIIYQKLANIIKKPIVNSTKYRPNDQSDDGGKVWLRNKEFLPQ